MTISSVEINNFKSIEYLEVPFKNYGIDEFSSNASIFIGINESGKSNILEAINTLNHKLIDYDYESTYFKLGNKEVNEFVDIYYNLDIKEKEWLTYKNEFKKKYNIPDSLVNSLQLESIQINYYLTDAKFASCLLSVEFAPIINLNNFKISKRLIKNTIKDKTTQIQKIEETEITEIKERKDILENIPLPPGEEILTEERFEQLFQELMLEKVLNDMPNIIYWKSAPADLINDRINLEEFKVKTSLSIPLRNIFNIFGISEDHKIKENIERALQNDEYKSELEDGLSKAVTQHVNDIWKEHKVKFKIKIDGVYCKVHVEDLSTEHKYYKMNHRSDGFKQFVSLILGLSTLNSINKLNNNIILLDEPEVHLHPSGVKYMKDEILKIGKNNFVFISTHSPYLVDITTKERHWIVEKNKKTVIKQIDDTMNFADEEVLYKSFGLKLLKELIPNNIFIVEGSEDKQIFNFIVNKFTQKSEFVIKEAGGCGKVYSLASVLREEKINSFVVLDDDDEGRNTKKDILKKLKGFYTNSNTFTLKDIFNDLPEKSTIEDLYPTKFIEDVLSNYSEFNIKLDNKLSVIQQIKNQDKSFAGSSNKEKLEKFKKEIAYKFIEEFDSKEKIEKSSPRFSFFATNLIKKTKLN